MIEDVRFDLAIAPTLVEHAAAWVDMGPNLEHLTALASEVETILELGVRAGVSTWALLDGLPLTGRMVSVDLHRYPLPERVTSDPRWRFVEGNDLHVPLDPAELVFIDTTHEYDQTLAELRLAERLGARIVALHDWSLVSVRDAVERWLPPGWRLSVYPSTWGLAVVRR